MDISAAIQACFDCYDQTSLEAFASSTDQAMEKTMEKPSAIMESSDQDSKAQRTETKLAKRNHIPMTRNKTHVHPVEDIPLVAGDSSHE